MTDGGWTSISGYSYPPPPGHTCRPAEVDVKFDGGRMALLCARCRKVIGYMPKGIVEKLNEGSRTATIGDLLGRSERS